MLTHNIMLKLIKILFAVLFALCINSTYAQMNIEIPKKTFKTSKRGYAAARSEIKNGDKSYIIGTKSAYNQALKHYMVAYRYNKKCPELNYKIGVCYLYSSEKDKALEFLYKAYEANNEVASDINFLIGKYYQLDYRFEEAIVFYEKYKQDSKNPEIKAVADKKINECHTGMRLINEPVRVFIDNLGKSINSKYPEYAQAISTDESVIIFTSPRLTPYSTPTANDAGYDEDLFVSHFVNGKWKKAANLIEINSPENEAVVGLSIDGQTLYTFQGIPNGAIFESMLEGETWSNPKKLNKNINTPFHETSASLSYDGKYLYFVSDRPTDGYGNKSFGGKDIFVSKKDSTGDWGLAKNIGPIINTKYDEEGIFIHPDGVTIYFSSKREGGMGGYDIFYSEKGEDENWQEPVNIGYPINSPDDDLYFVVAGNARYAYYSSVREDGFGFHDIYRITFLGSEKPIIIGTDDELLAADSTKIDQKIDKKVDIKKSNSKKICVTIMKGIVADAKTDKPLSASIEIIDNETDELVSVTKSNSKTGKYIVSLPSGKNYGIAVKAEDYLFYSENVNVPPATAFREIINDISMSSIDTGAKIILKNIFFDTGDATLHTTSFPELNNLVKLLEAYPNMLIEIGGHTDNIGGLQFNTKLSEDSAKSAVNYIINKGIYKDRLNYKG